ncbi:MAG: hypothetical protein K0S72_756, partial [Arthrobacter sp.]|nr:hypothetical protein [Arthrobacter sp.]
MEGRQRKSPLAGAAMPCVFTHELYGEGEIRTLE